MKKKILIGFIVIVFLFNVAVIAKGNSDREIKNKAIGNKIIETVLVPKLKEMQYETVFAVYDEDEKAIVVSGMVAKKEHFEEICRTLDKTGFSYKVNLNLP